MALFKSLRERIFVAFFTYAAISFIVSVVSFLLFRQMEQVEETSYHMSRLTNTTLQLLNNDNEFLVYETINPVFYSEGESRFLDRRQEYLEALDSTLTQMKAAPATEQLEIGGEIVVLDELLTRYDSLFGRIAEMIHRRGFHDYGLVGFMREYIHKVEDWPGIDKELLLMMRRHEKDYIIRNQPQYVEKLRLRIEEFLQDLNARDLPDQDKKELSRYVQRYQAIFDEIVEIDRRSGYRTGAGLSAELASLSADVYHIAEAMERKAADRKDLILSEVRLTVVVLVTISVVLTMLLSISFQFIHQAESQEAPLKPGQ